MAFDWGYAVHGVTYTMGTAAGGSALPNAPQAIAAVNYMESRSDGGYRWSVKYDLGFDGARFLVETRISLAGADPGALRSTWEQGIESLWNGKAALSDGSALYPIAFDVRFVDANPHYTVTVHEGNGRYDMLNWYTDTAWGPSYQDELAAHEYGHMIGMFDEYAGGATFNGYTTTGTLMADLTGKVPLGYFGSVDAHAEALYGRPLAIVDAGAAAAPPEPPPEPPSEPVPEAGRVVNGTTAADTLSGASGDDSIRGYAGNDVLYGLQGNDTLKGEAGNDTLFGGAGDDSMHGGDGHDVLFGGIGNDILWGSPGNDTLTGGAGADRFMYTRGSGHDVITDFNAAEGDRIHLGPGQFHRVIDGSATEALVDLGNGDTITLLGIARHAVQDAWFVTA
ncbi:calcium-binding protein [Azospirillum halopraeferens]|uniref:calcium-binding protein n=1 Tax=Azospirillum halopraeferens TaxID=34010 RepID=UPI000429EC22|nr:calcium-binding protein [Azospirillum halopraeferens]